MTFDQSGSLYMYELLPIWIVVFVFLKALLLSLLRISLYVWDFFETFSLHSSQVATIDRLEIN